jgi:group II intron reverse transcriptase/maturase
MWVSVRRQNRRGHVRKHLAREDKIVQRSVVEVLSAIDETDFLGFSYGFRPKRSQHQTLDALTTGIMTKKVNWVLDADVRAFFDTLEHGWLVKFVEHRVADRRVVRLIQKWLSAGVLEDGKRIRSEVGTVQGGSISPLLANVYLHHVFDLWVQRWRKKQARGDVVVVRWADDFVVGFQHRAEAERFLTELRRRMHDPVPDQGAYLRDGYPHRASAIPIRSCDSAS